MKILISNYASDSTTEPLYLNTIFNQIGCKSTILSSNTSIYDGFDISKPDVYITNHEILSRDLLVYLTNNSNKIDLIINITGITQENLSKLDAIFSDNNIKPVFYFVNQHDHGLHSRTNIVPILHGADLFLTSEPAQYTIDCGIFIDSKDQVKAIGDSYHYITYNKNIDQIADIFLPVHRLSHLYPNYQRIVWRYFYGIFPQAFFDAAIRSGRIFFDLDSSSNRTFLQKNLNKLLGGEDYCDLSNPDSGNIYDIVANKHTCLNRAKSFLSQLPAKDYVDNLQKLIEENRGKI